MSNILISTVLAVAMAVPVNTFAGEGQAGIADKPKFSGYIIGQYQSSLQSGNNSNTFNIRMARVSVTGHIMNDFEYKLQGHLNGNTATLGNSPRMVDMFVEWQKYSFARVKAGQFKRPFTFENAIHPIDQGFMGYSQNVQKLSGLSDRCGEQPSNGRDIGIQVQGDLLPDATGRHWLHYQVGVFNGQGINTKDVDNRKDIIGGLWLMPVVGLRIGVSGWAGSYARNGKQTDEAGNVHQGMVSLSRYRYALSAEYRKADWQFRSEYIHSTGGAFKTSLQNEDDRSDATVNTVLGDKADGLYALCVMPVISHKLRAKARYDLYRRTASWADSRTQYEIGVNYTLHKNIEVLAEYAFVNDRSQTKHNYSMADVELCVRF